MLGTLLFEGIDELRKELAAVAQSRKRRALSGNLSVMKRQNGMMLTFGTAVPLELALCCVQCLGPSCWARQGDREGLARSDSDPGRDRPRGCQ